MSNLEETAEGNFEKIQYKTYRTSCMCGEADCDLILDLEQDGAQTNLTLYKTFIIEGGFIKRLKSAISLMVTGRIKVEGIFMFRSAVHATDFARAILNFCNKKEK